MFKSSAVLLLFILFLSIKCLGYTEFTTNELKTFQAGELQLVSIADSMYTEAMPEMRIITCQHLIKELVHLLRNPNSYQYPFDSLNTRINILPSPDGAFRIFNWSLSNTDYSQRYYGAIQMPSENLKLIPLIDVSATLTKGDEDSVFTEGHWWGALYYRIMPEEVDGQKIYTLFGINRANPISTKKVLDALTFREDGPVFGQGIFGVRSKLHPDTRVKRFILEYKKDIQASLNWDKERNAIYFDRLMSETNDPTRKYTYVPSGNYDGFKWTGSEWHFVEDLIPITNLKDGDAPLEAPLNRN